MSETHEENLQEEPWFPKALRLRRAILSNESIQDSVREEMLQEIDRLVNEVQRSRSIIRGMESLLQWILKDAGWMTEYTKDVTECDCAEKTLFERSFGGILVRRIWLESALRRLQDTERSRREGRIG